MRVRYSFSSRRTGNIDNIRKQRKPYPKIAREVIGISDIILEVLDARFIEETRNHALEWAIKKEGKKIIYVLNKIDLVDAKEKKREARAKNLVPFVALSCKERKGAHALRNRIKIEASRVRKDGIVVNGEEKKFDRIQVGVIGYPNTGKSSLINFLIGKHSSSVAAEAGWTKGIQKVKFSKDILMLDTPGVIPDTGYSTTQRETIAHHAKLGARTYNKVKDPEFVVAKLLDDYLKAIENFYGVNSEGNSEKLIEEVGRKKNFLVRGGEVDFDRTARFILKDWQEGKIRI